MNRLGEVALEELYELKEKIDQGKPRERVLAAIGRKQGNHLDTLAERHGVVEKTIRNWLDRFEEEPIEQAPYDTSRPGRPAKIQGQDREQLFEQLQQPQANLATISKRGQRSSCSPTSKRSTASNTTKTTPTSC